jgi:hypothetical protein
MSAGASGGVPISPTPPIGAPLGNSSELRGVDPPPAALRHDQELEGHEQALLARASDLGHPLTQPTLRSIRKATRR